MACIKSAPRSALAAFAPGAPYLAAGTMAGAVDLSFSSTAALEIFELDFASDSPDLPVVASCPSAERFNRLWWGKPLTAGGDDFALGLLAGGLDDGSIGVWNPLRMIKGSDDSFVAKLEKHVGPVRGLEFNSCAPNMLASGADGGELCIWDLAKPSEPTLFPPLKGSGAAAQTEVSFVSWNPKFQNIVASTSYNGITVAWDLKTQRPVTSFSNSNRSRCSVLQWNPDISTQLILASDDDNSPSLTVWDVRKTISPLREYVGHTKGVIAMSWCPYDSSFLLTCAKDNRTICWDTVSGEIACELPASTNWNFDVHWYPKVPGIISASSFDVKIGVYNIEACDRYMPAVEFVASARLKVPKWLKRPTGVSFGFGGKLVSFHPGQAGGGALPSASEIYVHQLVTEESLVSRSTEFEDAIQLGEKSSLRALCEKKSHNTENEDDKETWGFLKVMLDEDGTARTKLLSHLGFTLPDEGGGNQSDALDENLKKSLSLNKSSLAEGGQFNEFAVDTGEDFFNNYQPSEDSLGQEGNEATDNGKYAETVPEEPVKSSNPSLDDSILHALLVGDCKGAVAQCIAANRIADALVIAHVGSPSLWETTRDNYLKSSLSPYLKVVLALVNNDLLDLVNTRPLNKWKETLALLCAFARNEEWSILCDTLAARLLTVGNKLAATLCYICSGNIDKTVEIWSLGLKSEHEGKSYVERLQDLMEKTIVFALATGHKNFSASLTKLVENYAEMLASQGLLTAAMNYLKLLGSQETSHELAILRDRITFSIEETSSPKSRSFETPQVDHIYGAGQTNYGVVDSSHTYYQYELPPPVPQTPVSNTPYVESYQQSQGAYSSYHPVQQTQQLPEMSNPAPFQPTQQPQMFVPSQTGQVPQQNIAPPPVMSPPAVTSFVPANPLALTNVYRQTTLGAQLYSGVPGPVHQSGPPASAGAFPGQRFAQTVLDNPEPRGFIPVSNPNFAQRPVMVPSQPSSPTKQQQVLSVVAPSAPPPTVQTVDTSNVAAKLKPVVVTLTRLCNETSAALGGAHAHAAKKREIEDNSRKIGSLFAKLNSGDISLNAADKLIQLCQALDAGDFTSALQIQINLTTTDWDECNFWLAALKRMIKTRQVAR